MSELVSTYPLGNLEKSEPMDREEFYAEQIRLFHEGKRPNRLHLYFGACKGRTRPADREAKGVTDMEDFLKLIATKP